MDVSRVLTEIDAELTRLHAARTALLQIAGSVPIASTGKRRGRPKGSVNVPKPAKRVRKLTPEGRKRIAEAMKKRWAEKRKTAANKETK